MSGHTPGPWVRGDGDPNSILGANGWECVAQANDALPNVDDNASLMAAAPELLSELKNATAQMEWAAEAIEAGRYDEALLHVNSMVRGRKAAIAKAAGAQP